MKETQKRWRAVATYLSEKGDVDVEHFLEELADIDDVIERGPNWYALKDIVITLNCAERERITLEHEDADLRVGGSNV
jgi:hypothetical protein